MCSTALDLELHRKKSEIVNLRNFREHAGVLPKDDVGLDGIKRLEGSTMDLKRLLLVL
jgi:hypothetical protein